MPPHQVNAYYNPLWNEIVFPAAILQPPFFDVEADDAVNYGAIGAVIGHEIGHGFDDQGRKFDARGTMTDWWTEADAAAFDEKKTALKAQYDAFKVIGGETINGEFTSGENIGDLAGLSIAHKAYRASLGDQEAPVIDGFTGDQRFFMGWAQIWRRLYTDVELARRLVTDPSLAIGSARERRRSERRGVLRGVRREAGRRDVHRARPEGHHLVILDPPHTPRRPSAQQAAREPTNSRHAASRNADFCSTSRRTM